MSITQKQLFAQVRALGLTIRCCDGEYRITHTLGRWRDAAWRAHQENTAYYTTDRDDALATARAMAAQVVQS
jgi:hypothetical protein